MSRTKIEWATHTWNPVTGCTKVSEGCRNCYAERMAKRFERWGLYADGGQIRSMAEGFTDVLLHSDRLDDPLHWRKPRRVFVCSMSDLFHPDVPEVFIKAVFVTMAAARQHTFMVLTKRPDRMLAVLSQWELDGLTLHEGCGVVLPNVIGMVSVEDQDTANKRVPLLLQSPFAVRGVSCEPMLGPIDFGEKGLGQGAKCPDCGPCRVDEDGLCIGCGADAMWYGLDWVICGGESGPGARPMHTDWARSLRDQCQAAGVPFFFKQWGEWAPVSAGYTTSDIEAEPGCFVAPGGVVLRAGRCRRGSNADARGWLVGTPVESALDGLVFRVGKKAAGRELDGRTHDEFPEVG